MDGNDFFPQKRLLCRSVLDCSRLLNCLYRKKSENYSYKWDRGFISIKALKDRMRMGNVRAGSKINCCNLPARSLLARLLSVETFNVSSGI